MQQLCQHGPCSLQPANAGDHRKSSVISSQSRGMLARSWRYDTLPALANVFSPRRFWPAQPLINKLVNKPPNQSSAIGQPLGNARGPLLPPVVRGRLSTNALPARRPWSAAAAPELD